MPDTIIPQSNTEDLHETTKPFTPIQQTMSRDTINTLELLLREARSGNLTGLVYCAVLRGQHYFYDVTGDPDRDPVLGLGMASLLSRYISDTMVDERINDQPS